MANNIFIDFLPPWIETGVQPAFYDKESGTVLQQTARMYAKVNELVESVNHQNETIDDYINQFNELHDYVHDYFDNLNVQEEINNKLDVMAQDGSLTELIKRYIDPIYQAYETQINATLEETFTNQNARIVSVENLVDSAITGTPLVASSTAGMTNTDRIYVNSTDGHWYYYNGSAWTDGGVYQATAIDNESVDGYNLVVSLQKSVNYEEPTVTYTHGVMINGGGTVGSNANGYTSDAIELKAGDTIVFTAKGYSTNVSLLSSYKTTNTRYPLVVSQNSNVVTTAYTVTYSGKYYLCSLTQEPSDVKIYHKNITDKPETAKMNYIQNIICDETVDTESGYINCNNGNVSSSASLLHTDYIAIKPHAKIQLLSKTNEIYPTTDLAGLAYYNAEKDFLSGVQYTAGSTSYTLTPPQDAKYIRITVTGTMQVGFTLAYYDLNSTIDYLMSRGETGENIDRTVGLTSNAVFIGDSLTYGQYYIGSGQTYRNFYNYPYFLKKLMQIDTITELATSGVTATSWWNAYNSQITATDSIYFVWLGTNSTFTDTIDTDCVGDDYTQYANTETGNMGKILQKIKSLDNNHIIILNCFASGNHLAQTNEMLGKFAERFSVDLVIDINDTDVRNLKYHKAYTGYVNAVHLNEKGNNYIANIVNKQLNVYLEDNQLEMVKTHA